MKIPARYRNVICPWQSDKDIESAIKFCAKLWTACADDHELTVVFRLSEERNWRGGRAV